MLLTTLQDDLFVSLCHLLTSLSLSTLSMTSRGFAAIMKRHSAHIWSQKLIYVPDLNQASVLWTGLRKKFLHSHETTTATTPEPFEAYAYAYVCCKVAARIARIEYVRWGMLLHDACSEADRLVTQTASSRRDVHKASWRRFESQILVAPAGKRFDAATHAVKLRDGVHGVAMALRAVNATHLGILRVLTKQIIRNGGVLKPGLIWEVRRLARRFLHLQRLLDYARCIRVPA